MADALDTQALNLEINDMFINARTRLFIVSPYLSIYTNLRKILEDADHRGVNIVVVYRKLEESSDVLEWLSTFSNIYIGHSDRLHAKYYGEDHVAIIGSLNLYQYSQVNNEELGIIFDDRKDAAAFYDSFFFVQKIVEHSEPVFATIKCEFFETKKLMNRIPGVRFSKLSEPLDRIQMNEEPTQEKTTKEENLKGFCIRCGKHIGISSQTCYCEPCLKSWMQYKNPNYNERFCHICGKESRTTAYRPVCDNCYPGSGRTIEPKKDVILKNLIRTHRYRI